ncbi:MAG: hypothetical protein IPF96_18425 [Rhodobacter sp.]|nr:hypothetical protein [Rhodobacter sp.]
MAKQDTPKRKNGNEILLKVRVNLLDGRPPKDDPGAAVYAFARGGQVVASVRLGNDGIAILPIPIPKEATALNVVAGPAVDGKAPDLSELLRRGASRQTVRIDPDILDIETAFEVLPDRWKCWFASRCYVPGKLIKRTELDGMKIDLPVCGAEIEVYEVDPIPLVIARLPDWVLDRIRRWVIDPDPQPWDIQLPELKRLPLPGAQAWRLDGPVVRNGPARLPARHRLWRGRNGRGPSDLRLAAQTASLPQFRDALVRAPDLSRFLICRYFPGGVSKQLVATATTDDCGEFRAVFFRGCANPDQPDLYFKAKRSFRPRYRHDSRPDSRRVLHALELCLRHPRRSGDHPRARPDLPAVPTHRNTGG